MHTDILDSASSGHPTFTFAFISNVAIHLNDESAAVATERQVQVNIYPVMIMCPDDWASLAAPFVFSQEHR